MIKIWDAYTGDNTFTLVGHTGEVVCARMQISANILKHIFKRLKCMSTPRLKNIGLQLV